MSKKKLIIGEQEFFRFMTIMLAGAYIAGVISITIIFTIFIRANYLSLDEHHEQVAALHAVIYELENNNREAVITLAEQDKILSSVINSYKELETTVGHHIGHAIDNDMTDFVAVARNLEGQITFLDHYTVERHTQMETQIKELQVASMNYTVSSLYNRGTTGRGFKDYVLTEPCNLTPAQLAEGIKIAATKAHVSDEKLSQYAAEFLDAEKEYGVNALYLAAHASLESNWGKSNFAVNRYNFFGYGAYDSNPNNAHRYVSAAHGIMTVTEKIKADYLTEGGRYYKGPTLTGMNIRYATDPQWAFKISDRMKRIISSITPVTTGD
jgi:beta-N-acetylglucosaminidase